MIADLNNVAPHAFAGAIIGALFLRRFVNAIVRDWLHVDLLRAEFEGAARAGPSVPTAHCRARALHSMTDGSATGHGSLCAR
jgi:leucyl aminopeptidase